MPEPPSERGSDGARRRAAVAVTDWLVPEENPTGAVYGVIVIGALLAAESGRHETYLDTILAALVATGVYWVAHAYASVLGRRLETKERLTLGALSRALAHDGALLRGAAVPLLALVLAWLFGATQASAVTAALWSTIASLVVLELIAGLRSHAGPAELALELAVGATMGLGILALKIILH